MSSYVTIAPIDVENWMNETLPSTPVTTAFSESTKRTQPHITPPLILKVSRRAEFERAERLLLSLRWKQHRRRNNLLLIIRRVGRCIGIVIRFSLVPFPTIIFIYCDATLETRGSLTKLSNGSGQNGDDCISTDLPYFCIYAGLGEKCLLSSNMIK